MEAVFVNGREDKEKHNRLKQDKSTKQKMANEYLWPTYCEAERLK